MVTALRVIDAPARTVTDQLTSGPVTFPGGTADQSACAGARRTNVPCTDVSPALVTVAA
jgi:hypothetical protein